MKNSSRSKVSYKFLCQCILFCITVLSLLMFLSSRVDAAQVTAGVANVRVQPSTTAEISGTLTQNTTVTILEWSGEWAKIQSGSVEGWMNQSVLSTSPDDYVIVTGEVVNLRSGPGTSYSLVGSVRQGEQLILLDGDAEWYHVQTKDGTVAYILGSFTSKDGVVLTASSNENVKQTTKYVEITGTYVNIRTGAGTEYESIGTAFQGEQFPLIAQQDGWYIVQMDQGGNAYISSELSKVVELDSVSDSITSQSNTEITLDNQTANSQSPIVYIDGERMTFQDVEPMIVNDRTLVPMRAIFEAMGAEVSWIEATQTVVGVGKDQTMVVLSIGENQATVNGETIELDVPAQIMENRTMVPLRFVGESLGAEVAWDAATYRIDIIQPIAVEEIVEEETNQQTIEEDNNTITEVSPSGNSTSLDLNRNYLYIGTEKNELGLSVILSSMGQLNPEATKEGDVLTLNFKDMYISESVHMTQALGGGDLRIDAENTSNGVIVEVTMPENVDCQFAVTNDGQEISLIIENRIRNVGRKVYGETDEMITIDTVVPVKYQYFVDGRTMEIVLSNTAIGIAKEKYSYYGSVMDFMTVTQVEGKDGPEVHLYLQANQDCKFNTLLTDEGVLNIAVTSLTEEEFTPRSDRLIMIDAGHGGTEKGALYGGIDEREVNLEIALKLGSYLETQGLEVLYTRTGDDTVGLSERAQMANQERVTLFVSVHCNAATNESANGTETYFYAPIENPELFAQRMERQQLAASVQNNVISWTGLYDRGTKEQNLAVLRETKMPSVLVECGFLSNDEEREKLTDADFQQRIATGIGNGVIEYLNKNLNDLTIMPE